MPKLTSLSLRKKTRKQHITCDLGSFPVLSILFRDVVECGQNSPRIIASHDHSGSEHHMICFKTCISDQCHFTSLTNSICIRFICLMKSTCFYPIQVHIKRFPFNHSDHIYTEDINENHLPLQCPPAVQIGSGDRFVSRSRSALCLHEKHNARFCGDLPKRQLWQPKASV